MNLMQHWPKDTSTAAVCTCKQQEHETDIFSRAFHPNILFPENKLYIYGTFIFRDNLPRNLIWFIKLFSTEKFLHVYYAGGTLPRIKVIVCSFPPGVTVDPQTAGSLSYSWTVLVGLQLDFFVLQKLPVLLDIAQNKLERESETGLKGLSSLPVFFWKQQRTSCCLLNWKVKCITECLCITGEQDTLLLLFALFGNREAKQTGFVLFLGSCCFASFCGTRRIRICLLPLLRRPRTSIPLCFPFHFLNVCL